MHVVDFSISHGGRGECGMATEPKGGAVAEWVRALDWRPDGPGFESHCGKLFASELWQFRLVMFNLTGLNYFRHFPSSLP